jgi:hypothetical protein
MISTVAALIISTLTFNSGLHIDLEPAQPDGKCVEFYHTALKTGWTPDQWPTLDRLIWRESRCITTACGQTDRPDLRRCRDWGLLQINDHTWKSTVLEMDLQMSDLYDPYWNLFVARLLFDIADRIYGCGWQPWSLECD